MAKSSEKAINLEVIKKLDNKTITNVEKSEKAKKFKIIPQKTKINKKYKQKTRAMRRKGDTKMTDYFSRTEKACKRKFMEIGGGEEIIEI